MSLLPILSAGYRTIQLTQGFNTLVDMDDYNRFNNLKWYASLRPHTTYAVRNTKTSDSVGRGHCIYLHIAINPLLPGFETNHIDHDGLNNTKDNLEYRTRPENQQDQLKRKNVTVSKFKGVTYDKRKHRRKRWQAMITVNSETTFLGYYLTEIEAARAYDQASLEFHEEFGRNNEKLFGKYW